MKRPGAPVTAMAARLAVIQRQRETRRRDAERHLRRHYRLHRRIKWGPIAALVGMRRVQDLIFLGELEHRLGIVRSRALAHRAWSMIGAILAMCRDRSFRHIRRRKTK